MPAASGSWAPIPITAPAHAYQRCFIATNFHHFDPRACYMHSAHTQVKHIHTYTHTRTHTETLTLQHIRPQLLLGCPAVQRPTLFSHNSMQLQVSQIQASCTHACAKQHEQLPHSNCGHSWVTVRLLGKADKPNAGGAASVQPSTRIVPLGQWRSHKSQKLETNNFIHTETTSLPTQHKLQAVLPTCMPAQTPSTAECQLRLPIKSGTALWPTHVPPPTFDGCCHKPAAAPGAFEQHHKVEDMSVAFTHTTSIITTP